MSSQKVPVSAVVITHESERTLGACLQSLQIFEEVIVVDDDSQDQTLSIASQFQAKVLQRKFDGFGPQKDFGIQSATHDWVMIVDSDEVISQKLKQEIQKLFSSVPQYSAYRVPRLLWFLGRPLRFSGRESKGPIRLFDRRKGRMSHARVHEGIETTHPVSEIKAYLDHYSYLTLTEYFKKFHRYTSLGAKDVSQESVFVRVLKLLLGFPTHFLKNYLLKLGVLDGTPGLLWAVFSGVYPIVKYLKSFGWINP